MPDAAAAPTTELVLGRYRPLRPLGSGGSGSVWLAHDEKSGLEVALKIVRREGKAGPRAEREVAVAARLRHPHCLRAYGFGRDDRHVYIAYEYAPGPTLREAIRSGSLNDAAAVEAAAQILEALAHAHARRVVHRDVKPSNVLLVEEHGELAVKLLDFGLAHVEEAETLTAAGDVPGTLAYIAPERLAGAPPDPAGDVWSVGVLLWEALAGVHPFWTSSLLGTARAIENGAPPLASARPDLPRLLLAAVDRALALDPARRPSAERLARALRAAFAERASRREPRALALPRRPERLLPAGLAALAAGWSASALPFYPAGWPAAIAAGAAGAALVRPRLGLAVVLAAPVLPLGNLALGAALLYAAFAAAWLALAWRDSRAGLLPALGPLLALVGGLGLLPLAAAGAVRSPLRRGAVTAGTVLGAGLVAGIRHAPFPFTGDAPPPGLGIAGSNSPGAVAEALRHVLAAHPALGVEAVVLAAASVLLPLARARGPWGIAGFGAGLLAATLLAVP